MVFPFTIIASVDLTYTARFRMPGIRRVDVSSLTILSFSLAFMKRQMSRPVSIDRPFVIGFSRIARVTRRRADRSPLIRYLVIWQLMGVTRPTKRETQESVSSRLRREILSSSKMHPAHIEITRVLRFHDERSMNLKVRNRVHVDFPVVIENITWKRDVAAFGTR